MPLGDSPLRQVQRSRLETIEHHARYLQLDLWNRRLELFAHGVPSDPLRVLEPGVALEMIGFQVRTTHVIGQT